MDSKKTQIIGKRKSAVVAVIAIIALLLTGTFAWVDATQTARNEFSGDKFDVELIDQFEGPENWEEGETISKEVYAKNTGGYAIFVRVNFNELIKIGEETLCDGVVHSYSDCDAASHDYISWGMGTVYTMEEWIAGGRQSGEFWVLDADGWAYWAEKLAPDDETALLLKDVTLNEQPLDKFYYAIDVNLEAVSESDLDLWLTGANDKGDTAVISTDNAATLLKILSNQYDSALVANITVEPATADVMKGTTKTFTATVTMGDTTTNNVATWAFEDGTTTTSGGSTIDPSTGELAVSSNETAASLVVVATAGDGSMSATATVTVLEYALTSSDISAAGLRVVAYADANGDILLWRGMGSVTIPDNAKYALIVTTGGAAGGRTSFSGVEAAANSWYSETCPTNVKAAAVVPSGVSYDVRSSTIADHEISRPTEAAATGDGTAFALSANELQSWAVANQVRIPNDSSSYWSRSRNGVGTAGYYVAYMSGTISTYSLGTTWGVRPALWVKYAQ